MAAHFDDDDSTISLAGRLFILTTNKFHSRAVSWLLTNSRGRYRPISLQSKPGGNQSFKNAI